MFIPKISKTINLKIFVCNSFVEKINNHLLIFLKQILEGLERTQNPQTQKYLLVCLMFFYTKAAHYHHHILSLTQCPRSTTSTTHLLMILFFNHCMRFNRDRGPFSPAPPSPPSHRRFFPSRITVAKR